jgi:ComF family protein
LERLVFRAVSLISTRRYSSNALAAFRRGGDSLFALLFPADCKVCSLPIESFSSAPVCARCLDGVRPYEGLVCGTCGLFLQAANVLHGTFECGLCRRGAFAFEQARSFGSYDGILRSLIQRLKYDGYRPLAKPLANHLSEAMRRLETKPPDLILPVPLYPGRQRQRGFNQASLLAARLAKLTGIPIVLEGFTRVRDTPPQTGLRAAVRRKNVAGAFRVVQPERIRSRRLLLVDDVLTTGATANACAQALLESGAEAVCVLTLARAHPAKADVL